jgi:hypothetical protein
MAPPTRTPSATTIVKAKRYPNRWIYEIAGTPQPGETVAPERILGAWKIDANGEIAGEFVPQSVMAERYEPRSPDGSPLG